MEHPNKFWEDRYASGVYTYGKAPNQYFRQQMENIKNPGRLLLLAEGEGRNAVYAAQLGWQVTAVDFSTNAQQKALALAREQGVTITYLIADISLFDFKTYGTWDAIGLIYAHFPAAWRNTIHQACAEALNPEGKIILEAFHHQQLGLASGGPKNLDLLYTEEIILQDFAQLEPLEITAQQIYLAEGEGHAGIGEVVRGCFQKKTTSSLPA
jgi:SAM-dependent methyltransferase